MIEQNMRFYFHVTYVRGFGDKLQIWAQTDRVLLDTVQNFLEDYQPELDQMMARQRQQPLKNVSLHSFCCIRNKHGYRRAKIMSLSNIDNNLITVHYIDYGQFLQVPLQNICFFEYTPKINQLFSLPEAAIDFILADVAPRRNNIWVDDIIQQISLLLVNKEFWGYYQNVESVKMLKIELLSDQGNPIDFVHLLVQRQLAISRPTVDVGIVQPSPLIQETSAKKLRLSHQNSHQKEIFSNKSTQSKPLRKTFNCIILDIGTKHQATVSYVSNGPFNFAIILQTTKSHLDKMMQKINSMSHSPLNEPPSIGLICLGHHKKNNRYYRVVLNTPSERSCRAHFIDYGYDETLSFSELFRIPDEFREPEMCSIRFTLHGIDNWNITDEVKKYFGQLVKDKILNLHVQEGPESPMVQYCNLYLNNNSIKDMLIDKYPEACHLKYTDHKSFVENQREFVEVCYIKSIKHFYIQIKKNSGALQNLMDQITSEVNQAKPINANQIYIGMPCLAVYDIDGQWYRASIESLVENKKVLVSFVDYGNKSTVSLSNLRMISERFVTTMPKQAITCGLADISANEITNESEKIFEKLVYEKQLCMLVLDTRSSIIQVDLMEQDLKPYKSITLMLKNPRTRKSQEFVDPSIENNSRSHDLSSRSNKSHNSERSDSRNKDQLDRKNQREVLERAESRNIKAEKTVKIHSSNERNKESWRDRSKDHDNNNLGHNFDQQSQPRNQRKREDSNFNKSSSSEKELENFSVNRKRESSQNSVTSIKPNKSTSWREKDQNQCNNKSNGDANTSIGFIKEKSPHVNISYVDDPRCRASTPLSKVPNPNITIGAIKNCSLVFYFSPDNFYIHLLPDIQELDELMKKMTYYEYSGKVLSKQELKVDMQCVVYWPSDKMWYRSIIKSINPSEITVFFVDYGNVEKIPYDLIKEIDAEFMKLPAQAVPCKLFCPNKTQWSQEESDSFADACDEKTLEAEFVSEDDGKYQILLKEAIPNNKKYLNELYSNGINIIKAKETARKKDSIVILNDSINSNFEFAPLNSKWTEIPLTPGSSEEVFISWGTDPHNFFVQLHRTIEEFRKMMNNIQNAYVKIPPISETPPMGSSVLGVLPDDGVLYRAQILNTNVKSKKHLIQFIDYGDEHTIEESKLYRVEKRFMTLPKQAVHCSLKNIVPINKSGWSEKILQWFSGNAIKYTCKFHEKIDNVWTVSLNDEKGDLAKLLIQTKLAVSLVEKTESKMKPQEMTQDLDTRNKSGESQKTAPLPDHAIINDNEEVDLNLLENQLLLVRVNNLAGADTFFVQFYSSFSIKVPTEIIPKKIECSLYNASHSVEVEKQLKALKDKNVKMLVKNVDKINMRLEVVLYDLKGNLILPNNEVTKVIPPVCNMQILSSSHEVKVTWLDAQIWLQKTAFEDIEYNLIDLLEEYYNNTSDHVIPDLDGLYVALGSDNNCYRVKVIEKMSDEIFKTVFIDYGNVEQIKVENIRVLDPRFYFPNQLAVPISLPITFTCSNGEKFDALSILEGKNVIARFQNVHGKWFAELTDNGEQLSDKWISMGCARIQIVPGLKYLMIASYIENPNQFWLHHKSEVNNLHDLSKKLQLDSENYIELQDPQEHDLCSAKWTMNNKWYRVEVIDADEIIATVRFIDYGNTDVVNLHEGLLKQLPEEIKNIPRFAVQGGLDIIPLEDEWNDETSNKLKQLIDTKAPLEVLILADKSPVMSVDVFYEGKSVSDILIEEKRAIHGEITHDRLSEATDDIPRHPNSAYTSNIISVDDFYVHEEKKINTLEMIEDLLIMSELCDRLDEIREGLQCVAQFSEDKRWYRAVILSTSQEGVTVKYIDYGNTDTTQELRKIPNDLRVIPPLTLRCKLKKPDEVLEWPENATKEFMKIAANGQATFLLDVLEEDEEINVVKLTLDKKDIATELIKICSSGELENEHSSNVSNDIQESLSPVGKDNINSCYITCVKSPDDFWFQKQSDLTVVDEMTRELNNNAHDFSLIADFTAGKIVAAKRDQDEHWYRAEILCQNNGELKVRYIDSGNESTIRNLENVRDLPPQLNEIPPMATHCCLEKPETIQTWSEWSIDQFIKLCNQRKITFQFCIIDSSSHPKLIRLLYDKENVIDLILKEKITTATGSITNINESHQNEESTLNKQANSDFPLKHKSVSKDSGLEVNEPDLLRNCNDIPVIAECNISVDTFSSTLKTVDQKDTICRDGNSSSQLDDLPINDSVSEYKELFNVPDNPPTFGSNENNNGAKLSDKDMKSIRSCRVELISIDDSVIESKEEFNVPIQSSTLDSSENNEDVEKVPICHVTTDIEFSQKLTVSHDQLVENSITNNNHPENVLTISNDDTHVPETEKECIILEENSRHIDLSPNCEKENLNSNNLKNHEDNGLKNLTDNKNITKNVNNENGSNEGHERNESEILASAETNSLCKITEKDSIQQLETDQIINYEDTKSSEKVIEKYQKLLTTEDNSKESFENLEKSSSLQDEKKLVCIDENKSDSDKAVSSEQCQEDLARKELDNYPEEDSNKKYENGLPDKHLSEQSSENDPIDNDIMGKTQNLLPEEKMSQSDVEHKDVSIPLKSSNEKGPRRGSVGIELNIQTPSDQCKSQAVEADRPLTPLIPYEEKLLAGAVTGIIVESPKQDKE